MGTGDMDVKGAMMLDGTISSTAVASDQLASPMSMLSVVPVSVRSPRAQAYPKITAKTIAMIEVASEAMNSVLDVEWRSDSMNELVEFFSNEKSVIGVPTISMALVKSF